MFEEDHIKYNSFGKPTVNYSYQDFFSDVIKIFDMSLGDPWVAFYGEPEPDPIPESTPVPKKEEKPQAKPAEKKQESVKDSKPVPKPEEKKPEKGKEEAPLPGQIDIEDYPEVVPELSEEDEQEEASWQQDSNEQVMNEPEEQFEVVEADIVHSPEADHNYDIKVKYDAETGEVEVYLDGSKEIKLIRVIDTETGESWEVTINQ